MKRDITEVIDESFAESKGVKSYAEALQKPLNALFGAGPLQALKKFMNGTWLGHPLHPLLTDVPIGAWTVAVLLDLLALLVRVPGLGTAAAIALGLGVLAALAAIATGLLDWMDVNPKELSIGVMHGTINILATLLMIVSLLIRFGSNWDTSAAAFVVALAGYGLVMGGGFIGGSLVFRHGAMVNRNAFREEPDDFVEAIALNRLPEGQPTRAEPEGQPVFLYRQGDAISALSDVCSHYGCPLSNGEVKGGIVICPCHDSRFALADGSVKSGPATSPVPVYETRVRDGKVQVRLKKK